MNRQTGESLRGASVRLTLQFVALMTVVLVIVAVVVFAIVSVSVSESDQRAIAVASQLDSVQNAPTGTFITVVERGRQTSSPGIPDGLVDTAALATAAATANASTANGGNGTNGGNSTDNSRNTDDSAAVQSQRTVNGQTYLITTSSRGDRAIQAAVNLSAGSEELARLAAALATAGLVALIAAAGLSYLMARRAIRPLAEALTLQRQFVADASHELRTPLTILSTRAQILQRRRRDDLPEDVSTAVDEVVRDSKTLTNILDDLLIAADTRSEMQLTAVDVTKAADAAIATLHDDAGRLGVTLSRTGVTDGVVVEGSETALLRLSLALLSNALDHARQKVVLDIVKESGEVVIRVSDDGPGFDPEITRRAFTRFASSRTGTTAENGTKHYGLGLALVAEIAKRHHGTARIEPARAAGATVAVRIPAAVG